MILILVTAGLDMSLDDAHEMTRCIEHTDAVRKSGVSCTWIDKFGKPKLLYAAQALKRLCLDHTPQNLLELASIKLNEVMKRVPYSLRFPFRLRNHNVLTLFQYARQPRISS